EQLGDLAQGRVACRVARVVVDVLEPVDADQHEPGRATGAAGGGEHGGGGALQAEPVGESGERVAGGGFLGRGGGSLGLYGEATLFQRLRESFAQRVGGGAGGGHGAAQGFRFAERVVQSGTDVREVLGEPQQQRGVVHPFGLADRTGGQGPRLLK